MTVGLVLVSHVAELADGVRALAAQMAPDVAIVAAGGADDGEIGTSFEKVLAGVLAIDDGAGVAVLYDLGSAQMTAELVLETLDPEQAQRIRIADAPLVEGALAAATTAAGGADLTAVVAAAEGALASVPAPVPAEPSGGGRVTVTAVLLNPAGLHARPAARLAQLVNGFDARVMVGRPGHPGVSAESVLGVVAQGIRVHGEVEITATGPEARPAIDAVLELVQKGFDELDQPPEEAWVPPAELASTTSEPGVLRGFAAAPGIAVGRVRRLRRTEPALPDRSGVEPAVERRRLDTALGQVSRELGAQAAVGGPGAAIAGAHQAMLDDPDLRRRAEARIDAGSAAEAAWWQSVQEARELLAGGEGYVAERGIDVEDVGRAVLGALGVDVRAAVRPEDLPDAVVVAEELLPSDVTALFEAGVRGVALARGGRTAHAAIIARGLELPLVVRLGRSVLDVDEGTHVILDADAGVLQIDPPGSVRFAAKRHAQQLAAERERARAAAADTVIITDSRQVLIAANVGSLAEARRAVSVGADGVGLLRTELLYVDRPKLPGEEEQVAELSAILDVLGERPVTIRTLDVGGDKLLPGLRLDPWRNGPLGERGLRYALAHPEVLRTQLRAILRAAHGRPGEVWVMAPMVTVAAEAREFRTAVEAAAAELERESVPYARPDRIGVMVEVPAAALAADEICAAVDFVSVGSNDLAQYVMAAERTNDSVAHLYQPDHPALWRVFELLMRAAREAGCEVAVCGEIAGDPSAAVRLVELGAAELSMTPASIPAVKAALRQASR
ncbi:phosphoenolpyruvate--protein phosphotransferase [Actinopolymorpha alba]|uniref:phosphoenolpyruvate--protein phosphotransferase n=1 Tax=Actinopolymorpha alba TaxID=533267 RepID=UPI00037F7B22|nr:phosphoenolpyruvate--protein phosphotransferase [Actinopolymorpha alba]